MSTGRLESFSDGVIAVAITLLVLNIVVPDPATTSRLGHALAQQWPHYAAYITSFLTIGIIWINHHAMMSRLREADHAILILNVLLLMSVAVLPFATNLLATYLKHSQGQHLAAAIYALSFLVMSTLFSLLNRHVLLRKAHYLQTPLPEAERRRILSRAVVGFVPYAIAAALAPVSAYATLGVCAAVAVYYALPAASGTGQA